MDTFIIKNAFDASGLSSVFIRWLGTKPKEISIDLETTGLDPYTDEILMMGVGDKDKQFIIVAYESGVIERYFSIMLDYCSKSTFIGHNIKFDLLFLLNCVGERAKQVIYDLSVYDTMIVEQVLGQGDSRSNSLGATLKRRLNITADKSLQSSFEGMQVGDLTPAHYSYLCGDIDKLHQLKKVQEPLIDKYNLHHKIAVELSLVPVLAKMENDGIYLNVEKWKENIKISESEMRICENKMDKMLFNLSNYLLDPKSAAYKKYTSKRNRRSVTQLSILDAGFVKDLCNPDCINYGSPKQLLEVFVDFNLPLPADKHGKEGVGKENLQQYNIIYPDNKLKEFINVLLDYSVVKKRVSSFGENILSMLDKDNKLHTHYRQNGTATGRFSSGDSKNNRPNMAQIPRSNLYRHAFKAPPGKVLMTIDYSQCELVILAAQSKDATLIKLLSDPNMDLHTHLANAAWSAIKGHPHKVTKEERQVFKSVNFGLVYGATPMRVASILNVSIEDANKAVDALRQEIPKVFEYLEKSGRDAVTNGYVVFNHITNSRRWFPEVINSLYYNAHLSASDKNSVERKGKNARIQGTNADLMKEAMVYIYNNITKDLVLQVYDELVIALNPGDLETPEKIEKAMKEVANKYLVDPDTGEQLITMKAEYEIEHTWTK